MLDSAEVAAEGSHVSVEMCDFGVRGVGWVVGGSGE